MLIASDITLEGKFGKPFMAACLQYSICRLEEAPKETPRGIELAISASIVAETLYELAQYSAAEMMFRKAYTLGTNPTHQVCDMFGCAFSAREAEHWGAAAEAFSWLAENWSSADTSLEPVPGLSMRSWTEEKLRKEAELCAKRAPRPGPLGRLRGLLRRR